MGATACLLGASLLVSVPAAQAAPTTTLALSLLADGQSTETVDLGQVVTFAATLTDAGPSDASGVDVSELLPSGLSFVGATPSTGTYNANTGVWSIGTLAAGTSATLVVVAQVTGNDSTFSTTATAFANDASSVDSTATLDVNAALSLSETVNAGDSVVAGATDATDVLAGRDVTYQITAANTGPSSATSVAVTDDLPSNFTFDSYLTPSVGTVSISGGVLTWTIPSLAGGADAQLTYTETTNAPSAAEDDSSTVGITSTQTTEYGNADAAEAGATATVEVLPQANVTITDTDGATSVIPGTADTYNITVTDSGPSALTDATVLDIVPAGFTVTGHTSAGGATYTNLGDGEVEWTGIDLASGGSATFTLTGTVDPTLSAGDAFVNEASIVLPTGQIDTASSSNAVDTDAVTPTGNLSVQLTDSGDLESGTFNATTNDTNGGVATPGSSLTYTLVVANYSSLSTASNVMLSDPLPAGVTSASWSITATTGSASATGMSGTGSISDALTLGPGSSLVFTIDADVAASATAPVVSTASLQPPVGFADTDGYTSSTDVVALQAEADLTISVTDDLGGSSVTASTGTAVPGDTIIYTITASNAGPSDVVGAMVADSVPAAVDNWSVTGTDGFADSSTGAGGSFSDSDADIAAGDSITYSLTGTVVSSTTGTLSDEATLTPPSGVVDSNASAGASGAVSATDADTDEAAPKITSANSAIFTQGVSGTFPVTATGSPNGSAMDISESGKLPSGVVFTNNDNGTASIAGTPQAGTKGNYPITITASNGVAPAASQTFTLYVKESTSLSVVIVPSPAIVGKPLVAAAVLSAGDSGGTVSFSVSFDGGSHTAVSGCQSVSLKLDIASCSFIPPTTPGPGTYTFSASYSGDANYVSATGSGSVVAKDATSLSLNFPTSPHKQQSLTVSAKVSPTPNAGTVAFFVVGPSGKVSLPSSCSGAALSAAVADCSFTPAQDGTYTVSATYSGSTLYASSSDTATVKVSG